MRQAIIGDAIRVFRVHDFPRTRGARSSSPREIRRSHDATHHHPNRQNTVYRSLPVRRELVRARRRVRERYGCHGRRTRSIEATCAWPVAHEAGRTDGNRRQGEWDEHVGEPTARQKGKWCRIQVVGGGALAPSRARNGAVGRRPTCAMCQVGRFTSHHRKCDASARTARRRARRREEGAV